MIYEIRAKLLFDDEDEARDFYHDCELALAKSTFINSDRPDIEHSYMELLENHHDSDPNEPCGLIASKSNQPPPP